MPRHNAYLPPVLLVATGVALELAGLAVDARWHAHEAGLEDEGLVSFSNPGHVTGMVGIVLAVAGVLWSLVLSPTLRSGRRYLLANLLPAALFLTLATTSASYVALTDTAGRPVHEHHAGGRTVADVSGLNAEEAALVAGSRHDHADEVPFQAAEIDRLQEQLRSARAAAVRFENLEVALREGYAQVTQDLPRIGAHFANFRNLADGTIDFTRPEILIYAFQDGAWRFYGFSYMTALSSRADDRPPAGFAGPFDVWHTHSDWCFTFEGALVRTPEECAKIPGVYIKRMGYMLHLWMRENQNGIFSHAHPDLKGSDEKIFDASTLLTLLGLAIR